MAAKTSHSVVSFRKTYAPDLPDSVDSHHTVTRFERPNLLLTTEIGEF